MIKPGIYLQCDVTHATIEYNGLYFSKSKTNTNGEELSLQVNKDKTFILGDYDGNKLLNITTPETTTMLNEIQGNVVSTLCYRIQKKNLSRDDSEFKLMNTSNKIRNIVLGIYLERFL